MSSAGAPSYKPPSSSTEDVAILITGCQDFETSVRDFASASGSASLGSAETDPDCITNAGGCATTGARSVRSVDENIERCVQAESGHLALRASDEDSRSFVTKRIQTKPMP